MRSLAKRHDNSMHERTVLASISFPEEQYEVLERVAADTKVSLALVVRDTIDGCLKFRWSLLPQGADAKDEQ